MTFIEAMTAMTDGESIVRQEWLNDRTMGAISAEDGEAVYEPFPGAPEFSIGLGDMTATDWRIWLGDPMISYAA